jgi:hypothetical protein
MIVNHSFSTVISQLSFIIYQLSTNMKDLITGAEALMRSLEHQGVTTIFGYPGGSIMPVFDALYDHQNISWFVTSREPPMPHKVMPVYRVM